jgi:hypothetical protein
VSRNPFRSERVNGPIAQFAALTCHANAYLGGREIPEFFPSNSTCRFCDQVEFVELEPNPSGEPRERTLAKTPDEWIHELPVREVDGVRLIFGPRNDPNISDRYSAGFVGGGHIWTMEVVRDDGDSELWSANWRVWDRDAPERRLWRVVYRLDSTKVTGPYTGRNLAIVRQTFRDSLLEVREFSMQHTEGAFTSHFDEALLALDDFSADVGYHKDIALQGQLSEDAESLLKASMRAWVFGGMGSWNDMGFDGAVQTEYENVSDRLFDVVHEAIAAAVTSTYLAS